MQKGDSMEVARSADLERAIDLAFEGKTIKQIALSIGCSYGQLCRIKQKDPVFAQTFDSARAEGWLLHADSLLTIYEDNPDIETARIKGMSDNIRWLLERVRREMFGQSVEINHKVTNVRQALEDARSRLIDITPKSQEIDIFG